MEGKALMHQKIPAGSLSKVYTVNLFATGNYVLMILENGNKIHEEQLMIVR